jgi:DNA-binding MarR family transcriptional regulator
MKKTAGIGLKATKLALLQSKFHRITKQRMTIALRPFQLRTVDWIVLGFLDHRKRAVVMSEVAHELGIQSSFMTVVVSKLSKRGFIKVTEDKVDLRKKHIEITKEGTRVVTLMQGQFEAFFAPYVKGISPLDLMTYLNVISSIIENVERSENHLS